MGEPRTFDAPCGPITAYVSDGLLRAKGIPYATAARFQVPKPCSTWTEPFDASRPSPMCPQHKDVLGEKLLGVPLFNDLVQDEDCQRLSITLPASHDPSVKLPVLFFIYGGAYIFGAGDAQVYDPSSIVREHDIVAVMITYRVGLFGYIGDGKIRPANLGLLDQLEALRWVNRNIASFGGDPDSVTIAGQSAGADAVLHLLACENAPSLFRRAIMESAPLGTRPGRKDMLEALVKKTAHFTTASSTEEVVKGAEDTMIYARRFGMRAGMPIATQYGQPPLPVETDLETVWKRNVTKIDVLIGNTSDELTGMIDVIPVLGPLLNTPVVGVRVRDSIVKYFTHKVFEQEATRMAQFFADAGANVWRYYFTFAAPGNKYKSAHAIEMHLQFGSEAAWKDSAFLKGMTWSEVEEFAVNFRQFLADFIKGSALKPKDDIPGLISYQKLAKLNTH